MGLTMKNASPTKGSTAGRQSRIRPGAKAATKPKDHRAEQKKTPSQTLKDSEVRYRRLFEAAQDGILLLNAESAQIEDVNPYLMRMLGYTHAEFLGRKLWEVGAFADVAQSKEMFARLQTEGYVRYDDLPLKTKAGGSLPVEFVSNSYDCAGIQVIQCNIRDISERKAVAAALLLAKAELEEQVARRTLLLERANRELDSFSYSVAHDLRAPLRAIIGFSNIVVGDNCDKLSAESLRHLQRIAASAELMTMLIDDLLDLAHISRQVMHPVDIDLSALALQAAQALMLAHPLGAVQLSVQPGMQAHGDARLLRIVMDNLLGNAWKFSARNPAPHIEVGQGVRDGETVFFVRDDGAGFDMAYAGKLFGAFERLHSQEEFQGTGIGLSIVQRICVKHGGRIWAEGAVGKGATFYFTLGAAP